MYTLRGRRTLELLLSIVFLGMVLLFLRRSNCTHSNPDQREPVLDSEWTLGRKELKIPRSESSCVPDSLEFWPSGWDKYFKNIGQLECSGEDNWVYTHNGTVYISKKAKEIHGNISCQYFPVQSRCDGPTKKPLEASELFRDKLPLSSDHFEVKCVGKDGAKHSSIHAGIRRNLDRPRTEARKVSDNDRSTNPLGLNILMLGFDSVSRLNWMRNLPQSYDYFVKTLGGQVLENYNVVGDGTSGAVLPILTGKTEYELPGVQRGYKDAIIADKQPWIWKDLMEIGYVTQFGEDTTHCEEFTRILMSFQSKPVDHYIKPFYVKAGENYSTESKDCIGPTPRHRIMLNWVKDFFQMYPHERKFSFLFYDKLSHDFLGKLVWADNDLLEFLQFLRVQGHLKDTILILMSDHGIRQHPTRFTSQGKYEERKPFFSFRFPPKFQNDHPDAMKNFRLNTQRLTTPFDIHATFEDIINFSGAGVGDVRDRGISLFKEIPRERTCEDAGIEPHWCTCLTWMQVSPADQLAQRAANHLLAVINDFTNEYRTKCAELFLLNLTSAFRSPPKKMFGPTTPTQVFYQVTFATRPSEAVFEATAIYSPAEDKFWGHTRQIGRINKYGSQPDCIIEDFPFLRQFCYCPV